MKFDEQIGPLGLLKKGPVSVRFLSWCHFPELAVFLLLLLWVPATWADAVYFKDGSVTICRDRAWEEGDKVKCEFYGTVVSYPKNEVDRITSGEVDLADGDDTASGSPKSEPEPVKGDRPPVPPPKPAAAAAKPRSPAFGTGAGPFFYDPRRARKYWASDKSRHNTLKDAVEALAELYDRSPEWVKTHMGDSNQLPEIHRNLSKDGKPEPQLAPTPATIRRPDPGKLKNLKFYEPRRKQKYWVSDESRHDTLRGAFDALARQYGRSIDWVKEHMGRTNDLDEIHRNLGKALSKTPGE